VRRATIEKITICLVAILTTGAMACGGKDASTAPSTGIAGTYTLQRIDGAALPTEVFNGSASDDATGKFYEEFILTVKGGTLELDTEGNYRTTYDYKLVLDGVAANRTLRAQGTYKVNGDQICLLRDNGVDTGGGTIQGRQVTLELTLMGGRPNQDYVYRK
jgi:hypothetical protein